LTPVLTLIELGVQLYKAKDKANKEDLTLYQQQISSLIYLSTKTRPNIAFAVSRCARFMSNPNITHFRALDRIWKYLNKYPTLGKNYNYNDNILKLIGYIDAN
jgi:hypothetical protein